jgi:hypothetical protein
METFSGELTDFCFVLAPDADAEAHGSETIRTRFGFLAEETRMQLVAAVGERIRNLVERGSGRPITVAISLEPDAIHGSVTDQDEPQETGETRFEIPSR